MPIVLMPVLLFHSDFLFRQTALMTLKIDTVTEDMGGEYVCRASNVKGYSKDVVNVVVTGNYEAVL